MDVMTTLFLIVWFIYGNHLIYRYRFPRFEQTTEDPEHWCTKNVYMLTVMSVAYTYALVTLMILIVLIVVCTVHFQNRRRAIQEADEAGCT
jgi:phosphatidylserine synthase